MTNVSISRPLILVGMMAVGKTHIGKMLARDLQKDFYDADAEIERAAQMTITEIFEQYGEIAFRDGEHRVIKRLLAKKECVIATGGGAFMDAQTRAHIKDTGVSIWLNVGQEELLKRIAKSPHKRPLLAGADKEQKISDLLNERMPVYAEADIHIDGTKKSAKQIVDDISKALEAYRNE